MSETKKRKISEIKHSVETIFDVLKRKVADHNLTIHEISENTGVSEELIAIFFDNSNHVVSDLSRVFNFFKFKFMYRELLFRPYLISGTKTQLKITRTIKPSCSVYYDSGTGKFYKFSTKHKRNYLTEIKKQIILNEMRGLVDEYIRLLSVRRERFYPNKQEDQNTL